MAKTTKGKDPLNGRTFDLLPGWEQIDGMTFRRADGAVVWREPRVDTLSPVWWRGKDSYGFSLRGRSGWLRGYRGPEAAMHSVERRDPYFADEEAM